MATKSKPKPADVCRLTVHIRGVLYGARPIRPEASDVIEAWRLRRADGTAYVVAETTDGATCDCGDFVFRHDGIDATGCEHVRALRALGLIDPDGSDPHDWPAWTDSHAYTVTR
jgi:hypothetical protein